MLSRYIKVPSDERFGLISQIRRCSASVGANIAEGCGRFGDGDFQRFLQNAMGSASELDYHLLLACDLGYLDDDDYKRLQEALLEVKSMLSSLIRKIASDRSTAEK